MNKYTNILVLTVYIICLSTLVNSAQYDFNIIENYKTSINTDDLGLGTLLINPIVTNQSTYYLTKNENQTTYNLNNITADDYLLINYTNNSIIYFPQMNIYKLQGELITIPRNYNPLIFQEVGNNQTNFSININIPTEIVNKIYSLRDDTPEVDLNFSTTTFNLNQTYIIPINLSMANDYRSGDLTLKYSILKNNNSLMQKNYTLFVQETKKWNITNKSIAKTNISVGDSGEFVSIQIINEGNSINTIQYLVTGNLSEIITVPYQTNLYPSQIINIKFLYQTNLLQQTGKYEGELVIHDGMNSIKIPYNVSCIDLIAPKIISTNITNTMASVSSLNHIIANDNSKLDNLTYNCTYGDDMASGVVQSISNVFTINITPKKVGTYNCKYDIYDIYGNKVGSEFNLVSSQLSSIFYETNRILGKMKWDTYDARPLLEVKYKTNFTIKLSQFNYPNQTATIRISNGVVEQFIKNINESLTFEEVMGNFSYAMIGSSPQFFNGEFLISSTNEHVFLGPMLFSGELVTYKVPMPFCSNKWGDPFCCTVDNQDINATYICTFKYSGMIDIENLVMPTTLDEKNKYDNSTQEIISDLKHEKLMYVFFIILVLVLFLLSFGLYLLKVYVIDELYFFRSVSDRESD